MKPTYDKIVVRPDEVKTHTASGIALPEQDNPMPDRGEVLAVGPGKVLDDGTVLTIPVSVGDKVLFNKYRPQKVEIDGEDLLVISDIDLLAILK